MLLFREAMFDTGHPPSIATAYFITIYEKRPRLSN